VVFRGFLLLGQGGGGFGARLYWRRSLRGGFVCLFGVGWGLRCVLELFV